MSTAVIHGASGGVNLQATLSAASAQPVPLGAYLHHPIVCQSELRLYEDGRFECEHAQAPPDDQRTRSCINHSVAILLLELLAQRGE